jgi:hypothetical protein
MVLSPFSSFCRLIIADFRKRYKPTTVHSSPLLPQHSFWFAISNHAYLHDTPARLLSSAKKHPPQDVQQVPEI